MNILVTGATGFVGEKLLAKLIKEGHHVTAVVRNPKKLKHSVNSITLPSIDGRTSWSSLLKGQQVVIHLAAQTHGVQGGRYLPLRYEDFYSLNVEGTQNLAEAANNAGVQHFIYLSSIKALGESTHPGEAFTENLKPTPLDDYGKTKLLAEQALIRTCRGSTMAYTILRPPLVYGPGVKGNFRALLQIAASSWPLPFKDINNKRSFIYVDNLIDSLLQCIKNKKSRNQTFLIQDLTVSTSELVALIRQHFGHKPRLFKLSYGLLKCVFSLLGRKALIERIYGNLEVDDHKIRQSLRWKPLISAEEGLKITTTWYGLRISNSTKSRG